MRFFRPICLFVGAMASIFFTSEAGKVKRVMWGDPVKSNAEWKTQFVVAIVQVRFCLSNQLEHEVKGCQEKTHCTGSLLTMDFIITACHCVVYAFFTLNPKVSTYKPPTGLGGFLGIGFDLNVGLRVMKNALHKFYSELAVLAGDHTFKNMKQRRHVEKAFPHPVYDFYHSKNLEDHYLKDHDIALVRLCKPFDSSPFLKPAPIKRQDQLKPHWESIIDRNTLCLIPGFGLREDPKSPRNQRAGFFPKHMRYTWRYMMCSTSCEEHVTIPGINPCTYCTAPVWPRQGNMAGGDSGGPVICDGFVSATNIAGHLFKSKNFTSHYVYAIHCIQNAITPERVRYYRSISAEAGVTYLEGVDIKPKEDRRRHRFARNFRVNGIYQDEVNS